MSSVSKVCYVVRHIKGQYKLTEPHSKFYSIIFCIISMFSLAELYIRPPGYKEFRTIKVPIGSVLVS